MESKISNKYYHYDPDSNDEACSDIISQEGDDAAPSQWTTDPWSSDPWNVPVDPSSNYNHLFNETSFDTLAYKALPKNDHDFDAVDDPFGEGFSSNKILNFSSPKDNNDINIGETRIHIVLKERLSILFNNSNGGTDPICKVVGSIYLKPTNLRKINNFCLTIRDKLSRIEHWEQNSCCNNITAALPHLALDKNDRVFLISLEQDNQQDHGLEAPIVSYSCVPTLRPMPMLLKTKFHHRNNKCRLGIRIRANPQNNYVLSDIVILVIVSPHLEGGNVTMSRKGGKWDEMKRTIIWTIHELNPGEIVDIQAQFQRRNSSPQNNIVCPVLARLNCDTNFSKIDMNSDYSEEGSSPVILDLDRSATVLYRKV